MAGHNELAPAVRYLFDAVEPGLHARLPHEILASAARRLRDLIRAWWGALEAEVTAGVSIEMMEKALVGLAEKAAGESSRMVSRAWTKGSLNWKSRFLQTDAEDAIAERFLRACERLGILVSRGWSIGFTHTCLLETYLGAGLLTATTLPLEVRRDSRLSLAPLHTSRGRSTLAMLALADPQALDGLLMNVATENLHLATWFLYCNAAARDTHGEWLAAQIFGTIDWDIDPASRQSLEHSLYSLGPASVNAARRLIDERAGNLPGYFAAIALLSQYGNAGDLQRLQSLRDEPAPGHWEVTRLRQLIRDAEALVFDEAARKRYEHEEGVELAKQTAIFVLKTVGTIITKTSAPSTHWNHDTKKWTAGQGVKGTGSLLGFLPTSDFLQQQAALRELLAQLPPLIERRKVQVTTMGPQITEACASALAVLSARAGA